MISVLKHKRSVCDSKKGHLLGIIGLAIDGVILDEAGGLTVQSQLTDAASQTVSVPRPTVDLQQVLVGDGVRACGAHPLLRLEQEGAR